MGWIPAPSAAAADLPWIDVVEDHGAAGDGVTDDTAALQAAIDAAEAAGGATLYFPAPGPYIVAGALQDTGRSNAQLLLPIRDIEDDEQVTIRFLGLTPPPTVPSVVPDIVDPAVGVVIQSTLASGSGGALLGGMGPAGSFEDFTMVHAILEGVTFRMPANTTHTAIDLRHVVNVTLNNVVADTGQYTIQDLTEPTTAGSFGVRLPGVNNGAWTRIGALSVLGYYNGVEFGEHLNAAQLNVWGCKRALVPVAAFHANYIARLMTVHCEQGITPTGRNYLHVDQFNIEHADAGWWITDHDINDPSDFLYGSAEWKVTLAGTGHDSTFTVTGGANFQHWEMGELPAGGAVAFDDLTDVTLTTETLYDRVHYNGTGWVNTGLIWKPLLDDDGAIVTDGAGDPVMGLAPQ